MKSLKFQYFCFIFLLSLTSFKLTSGFKCNFIVYDECTVQPGTRRTGNNRNDFKVKTVNFNGKTNKIEFLSHSDFQFCEIFENLEEYYISVVKSIGVGLFKPCTNLELIWIKDTNINEIPEDLFSENSNLIELKLEKNQFTTLPENVFSNLHNLEVLSLYYNKIDDLPSGIFRSLRKLSKLSLSGNYIEKLDSAWFENVVDLKELDLSFNNVSNLPRNVFKHLKNLEQLQLYENLLTVIHSDSFGIHKNLKIIRLTSNLINAIDSKLINKVEASNLFMEGNICCKNDVSWSLNKKEEANRKLRKCFANYQPEYDNGCGDRNGILGLVFDGTITRQYEYPWNVALERKVDKIVFCGGTLVSRKIVVTAAHCMKGKGHAYNFNIDYFLVLLGVFNLETPNEFGRVSADVKDIRIHPDWNLDVNSYDADIAILELRTEVEFSRHIQPICIPSPESVVSEASEGIAVGFGRTETGQPAKIAQKLKIPIFDYHTCTRNNPKHRDLLSARTFCGGPGDGRGVCEGDSGSGVYVTYNDRFYLRGVVSASLLNGVNECRVDTQAVFTDVSKHYDWIKSDGVRKYTSQSVLRNRRVLRN